MDDLQVGSRIQIPRDQNGNPVLKFDRRTKEYVPETLQWFEVIKTAEGSVTLKAIWPYG